MVVKAVFKGKDGSCGYQKGKEYYLLFKILPFKIASDDNNIKITPMVKVNGVPKDVEYKNLINFLNNWEVTK